jgi:hypothetical protein
MQRLHSPCTGVLTPQQKANAVVNTKIWANAVTSHKVKMVRGSRPFDNSGGREATDVEASADSGNRVITARANCAKVGG